MKFPGAKEHILPFILPNLVVFLFAVKSIFLKPYVFFAQDAEFSGTRFTFAAQF